MCMKVRFLVVTVAVLALNAPLVAHYSVAVNFDGSREITIKVCSRRSGGSTPIRAFDLM